MIFINKIDYTYEIQSIRREIQRKEYENKNAQEKISVANKAIQYYSTSTEPAINEYRDYLRELNQTFFDIQTFISMCSGKVIEYQKSLIDSMQSKYITEVNTNLANMTSSLSNVLNKIGVIKAQCESTITSNNSDIQRLQDELNFYLVEERRSENE